VNYFRVTSLVKKELQFPEIISVSIIRICWQDLTLHFAPESRYPESTVWLRRRRAALLFVTQTPIPKIETVSKMSLTSSVFTWLITQKEITALFSSLPWVVSLHLELVEHLVFCLRYNNKHKNQSNFSSGIQFTSVFPGGVPCSCDCNQLSHYLWACFAPNSQFLFPFFMQRAVTVSL
jgi:hypothetical protein